MKIRLRLFVASLSLFCLPPFASGENWPQWRGPNNDGISNEKGLPAEFNATRNLVWKLAMPGMAGSTPVIWGKRIFLTSEDGGDVALLCVSTEGKELWKSAIGPGKARFRTDEGNHASPSPSTDGKNIYVFTGTGDFACFDFEGKEVWKFNAQERYGKFKIQHGMHVTPLLHGDRLYLALLHSGGWWVVAIDKADGKEAWKIKRESDARDECEQSYASPVLGRNDKEEYLIIHGCDYATAHSLKDGGEIWRVGDLNPKDKYEASLRLVTTPLATADLIVIPTAKSGPVVGIKPDAKGLITAGSAGELWRKPKITPDVPSPLLHDGLVYLCRENGVLICLDAKTGQEHYQERLHNARYRASPVYADGKIYCTSRDGIVSVVKTGPKYERLAENKLPDQLAASPAISGGKIYIRGFGTLYAFASAVPGNGEKAADDSKPEAGFTAIFNGKDLTGWKLKKGEALEGKTAAAEGRFKVTDGILVIDPKVKGDVTIETAKEIGNNAHIKFEFLPGAGCNNDLYFLGLKFDIKKEDVKNLKFGEWNEFEIVAEGDKVEFKCNGQTQRTGKTKVENSPLGVRAELGPIQIRKMRVKESP